MELFTPDMPFWKGNLHTHTQNSDGRKPVQEVVELYERAGYDFLALTDHWKCTVSAPYYYKNMLVLPGIELDYNLPAQVIHIVGIGVSEGILATERRFSAQRGIYDIRKAGGCAILAHPQWSLNTPELIASLRGLTAVEIYNSVSATPWNGDRADSCGLLDIAAANGTLLNTVASDDSHFYTGEACTSYIMLQADRLTPEAVMEGLRRGSFYASRGPRIHQIEVGEEEIRVRCSPAARVVFHSDLVYVAGRCVAGEGIEEASYPLNPARHERFVRAIVVDAQGRSAWANPINLAGGD